MNNKSIIILTAVLCLVIGLGLGLGMGLMTKGSADKQSAAQVSDWTCSMHPQVSLPQAGDCPICGMDLIPRQQMQGSSSGNVLELNDHAKALARVETVPVRRGTAIKQLRLTARIEGDQTRMQAVTVLGSGRLEKLYANYLGMPVNKGDHLAEVFSPEFSTAAAELLAAAGSTSQDSIVRSARRKLQLLGVSDQQIETMLKSKQVPATYTLFSPLDGIISTSLGHEGEWFKKDQKLFEILNLDEVWLQMDVYESQLSLIHYGQKVTMAMPSFPGRSWEGVVSFIQPMLNPKSRSVQVRVTLANKDGALRPHMFAYAHVGVRLDAQSRVIQPSLKGKWISPMHPEIIRDEPGQCPVCGMDLVSGEKFIKQQENSADQVLLIPDTAPLIIDKHAVVYVAVKESAFEPRLVKLGHHVGDQYIVLSGLEEGEQVVSRGAFRIDSDLQIQARPSMMTMWPDKQEEGPALSAAMLKHVEPHLIKTVEAWLAMQEQLSKGNKEHLLHHLQGLEQQLKDLPHRSDLSVLEQAFKDLQQLVKSVQQHPDNLKEGFQAQLLANVSEALIKTFKNNDIAWPENWTTAYCPMVPRAGGKEGSYWLQKKGEVENPFFLGGMRHCGEIKAFGNE